MPACVVPQSKRNRPRFEAGGTGNFDRLDASVAAYCLSFLSPRERLETCCSTSRSWLGLRREPCVWPSLEVRSSRGYVGEAVSEACLARLSSLVSLGGLKRLRLEDSQTKKHGVGFARGWRPLLQAIPAGARLESVCLKGRVFKAAALKLLATKFGDALRDFEYHSDQPDLVADLLRRAPGLASLAVDHLSEKTCDAFAEAATCLRRLAVLSWAGYSDTALSRSIGFDYLCTKLGHRFPHLVDADLKKVFVSVHEVPRWAPVAPLAHLRRLAFSLRPCVDATTVHVASVARLAAVASNVATALARTCPLLDTLALEFESTVDASVLLPFVAGLYAGGAKTLNTLTLRGLLISNLEADATYLRAALLDDWLPSLVTFNVVFADLAYFGLCVQNTKEVCSTTQYFTSLCAQVSRLLDGHFRDVPTHALHVGFQGPLAPLISSLGNVTWVHTWQRRVKA